jgi:nucleoside-diphosphate-sugar epimerase
MPHNILITGASGYLGGTLLARFQEAKLPPHGRLYALVRSDAQAKAVKQYGAESITINLNEPRDIKAALINHKITIVYYLIDARGKTAVPLIEGLSSVKEELGQEVHFIFTTGAKMFSSHAGAPTDGPLLDTEPTLYDIQKRQKPKFDMMGVALNVNNSVIETAEQLGVRAYIFAPCIVYGKGEGFGNPISIQTVAIVKAAKKVGGVFKVDEGRPTWPVCHVVDNATLYLEILRGILEGRDIGHGKSGYFLASPGSVAWDDLYAAIGKALKKRGLIEDEAVKEADNEVLVKMGEALGCPKEIVPVQLGGS